MSDETLLKFLDSKRKELFPCTTSSQSIIHLQRKHVYLKHISTIKFISSSNSTPPTSFRDTSDERIEGLVNSSSSSSSPPESNRTLVSSSTPPTSFRDATKMFNERIEVLVNTSSSSPPKPNVTLVPSLRRGTFESIGGCLKRVILESGSEGISRQEILKGVSACTPQTPGQIHAMLRRFDQKGLIVYTGGRYYSSEVKIEVPIIITPKRQRDSSQTQPARRSNKRVKIESRHRKRSSAKRSPMFKIQFNGMKLCAVHTHLLLTQKVFREIQSTSSPTVPFLSSEWFRHWSQHEPSCTSDDLKMLQYLGLVSKDTNRAIESHNITLPLYPGRDMNDTYVLIVQSQDTNSKTNISQVHSAS